jgi:hypothetical protein
LRLIAQAGVVVAAFDAVPYAALMKDGASLSRFPMLCFSYSISKRLPRATIVARQDGVAWTTSSGLLGIITSAKRQSV